MMLTTENLSRRKGVLNVIEQTVKLNVQAGYVKVMEKRSTTPEATEEVHWRMFQLGLYLVQQIGVDNLSVHLERLLHIL